jgi:hypothetical protein
MSAARSVGAIMGRRIAFGTKPAQKYRNKPTMVDGIQFSSKKEAKRWTDLKTLLAAGLIRNLERQVTFRVEVCGKLICRYIADFTYEEDKHGAWSKVVEDAKGYPTPVYVMKRKLMAAVHGVEIRET